MAISPLYSILKYQFFFSHLYSGDDLASYSDMLKASEEFSDLPLTSPCTDIFFHSNLLPSVTSLFLRDFLQSQYPSLNPSFCSFSTTQVNCITLILFLLNLLNQPISIQLLLSKEKKSLNFIFS